MTHYTPEYTRRLFLRHLMVGAASLTAVRAFSEEALRFIEDGHFLDELVRTPSQIEGPFYPTKLPLDVDNDLILIKPSTTPAVGKVTHFTGRVLDLKGEPLKGLTVEIWQVDGNGVYLHEGSDNGDKRDRHFQGFGRFETAFDGAFKFRTVKPVAYPGRTPHIHVKVKKGDRELLTTQLYIKDDPGNARDVLLNAIRDERQRASLIMPFTPVAGSRVGELAARCDLVLGFTPDERE